MHQCCSVYDRRSPRRRGFGRAAFTVSMASLSSSFQRSSRYSTSTVRSFTADPLRPRLHSQFGEETSISSITNTCGEDLDQSSWGEPLEGCQGDRDCFGGYHGDQQYIQRGNDDIQAPGSDVGVVKAMGENYFLSADVSGFEPHEVVVVAYNQSVVIHAEKMGSDGSVADRFTHKSVLPADMDPLSVSCSLSADRTLIISIGRIPNVLSKSTSPVFTSETHL